MRDEKVDLLNRLIQEYNDLSNTESPMIPDKNLDKKIELGQMIRTLRLELDKGLMGEMNSIKKRLMNIIEQVKRINE